MDFPFATTMAGTRLLGSLLSNQLAFIVYSLLPVVFIVLLALCH